jgi:hypothetical protein
MGQYGFVWWSGTIAMTLRQTVRSTAIRLSIALVQPSERRS